ncbi:MAG: rhodanese-like domain-containing protein [Cyclobacteriaceae bacterium]|nr:rhodanese-like domain-containing protein [Cyclobacteriaceae bacterium]
MGLLSFLGKKEESQDLKALMERGAIIIDVRTPGEFNAGHVVGSKNIPLDAIAASITDLKGKNVPIITCCASGMRSGVATNQLKSVGIESVNGGSWYSVKLATNQNCE